MQHGDIWKIHLEKAASMLEGARQMHASGMYDSACVLAAASCLQASRATAVRLRDDHDPRELLDAVRLMCKDGRLPPKMSKTVKDIIAIQLVESTTSKDRNASDSEKTIELADTFGRVIGQATEVSASRRSPIVIAAAAKANRPIPKVW